jgi:hypothetical protein
LAFIWSLIAFILPLACVWVFGPLLGVSVTNEIILTVVWSNESIEEEPLKGVYGANHRAGQLGDSEYI